MNTAQKYAGKGNNCLITSQAAQNKAQTIIKADNRLFSQSKPISVEAFIAKHPYLIGDKAKLLAEALTHYLQDSPVRYDSVLDGIRLLRGFLPQHCPPAHYALLLRGHTIIGVVHLRALIKSYKVPGQVNYQRGRASTGGLDVRQLMRIMLEMDATRLLMVTTRLDFEYQFDEDELSDISLFRTSLDTFGVELLDWILFYPDLNVSRTFAEHGTDGLDEGVTIEALELHGVSSTDSNER